MPEVPRLVLSVEAAASALSISRTRMFSLIKSGAIKTIRVGRLRRIPAESLNDYVDQLVLAQAGNTSKDS
jgi:excisionase family DNA binding protein